ncbi:MAG: hypothetical protein ACR2MM_05545 [Flavobacteriaceae bacterium]
MELGKIEKLIDKYFEASTTVAEEKLLQEYFTNDGVAPELEKYAPLFNYLSHAKEERFTKQVPLKPRTYNYRWISVAAVAVLAFGIYFGPDSYRDYQEQREAEYAYNETKKALSLLASNLERGTEKVAYLKEFEQAKQKIYKND